MSYFVLVLGINTTENDMFGGIVDLEKDGLNSEINEYLDLLNGALGQVKGTGEIPSVELDGTVNCYDCYETIPFLGNIEEEILVYTE